jgi:prevent-host-death family protein
VLEDHEPLRIVGGSRGDVIVVPAKDFENMQETISDSPAKR